MAQIPHLGQEETAASQQKPTNVEEYKRWMKTTLNHDYDLQNQNQYKTNMLSAIQSISQNDFVPNIENELTKWEDEYRHKTGSDLFMVSPPSLKLGSKPYESSIDKGFRINILWNKQFPKPPKKGWVTPVNVYSQLNDLVRTRLVCKFIDGPEFLTKKLVEFSRARAQGCKVYSQQRDEGYYAHHYYAFFDVPIVNPEWTSTTAKMSLEIQVTTQLQEILGDLTHPYFQRSRIDPRVNDNNWKWEIGTNRFRSAYMAHALHLLEAIIIDLREGSKSLNLTKESVEKHET